MTHKLYPRIQNFEKVITECTAIEYAKSHEMEFIETSSKLNSRIEEAFVKMATTIYRTTIKRALELNKDILQYRRISQSMTEKDMPGTSCCIIL